MTKSIPHTSQEPHSRTALEPLLALAYGIVLGLMFPLAISSTFLRESGLSHGAGNLFGVLFLVFYGTAMFALAFLRKFADKNRYQFEMPLAIGSVFAGNMLMLLASVGEIQANTAYAVATAALIGTGLASLELMLMTKAAQASRDHELPLAKIIAAAFIAGTIISAAIFLTTGPLEIAFALSVASVLWIPYAKGAVPEGRAGKLSFSKAGMRGYVKAILCLAVLSFVFGAVSQIAAVTGEDIIPVEFQGVAGLALASATAFVLSRKRSAPSAGAFYNMLFPVVAAMLVSLPFITVPAINMAATVLVFVAYYMASLNVRVIVCELASQEHASVKLHLGLVLGISSFLMLAGVAFGATALSGSGLTAGLSGVSLVSLFALAMISILLSRMDLQDGIAPESASAPFKRNAAPLENVEDSAPATEIESKPRLTPESIQTAFAQEYNLTTRETDVLELLLHGRTREYIATELGISANTVKGYIHNVYQKCNVASKQDLLDRYEIYASKQDLLDRYEIYASKQA